MNWQPIETAPKDGTRVALWRNSAPLGTWQEFVIAEWHYDGWCWPDPRDNPSNYGEWSEDEILDGYNAPNFTHWMPLPEPPRGGDDE